ncbi:nuclear transport factor 2 family protein [Hyphococcus sp.]|uniref:YybH family protein n=1 Tax=Hyphococcus sp. TaxID=2038636 RepID=UPI003CCC0E6F
MIRAISIITAAVLAPASVAAQSYNTTCTRGGDARTIEVVTPGEVGQSCDVRYTRSASNISVPYHADNSDAFCNEKARALVQRLSSAGFSCAAASPSLRAQAEEPAPQSASESDFVIETQRVAETSAPEAASPQTPNLAQPSRMAAQPQEDEETDQPGPVMFEPAPASVAANDEENDGALEDEMNKILAQPAAEAAPRGPAQLVGERRESPRVGPQPSPVGRFAGADPETPRRAVPVTQASATDDAQSDAAEPLAAQPAPASASQTSAPQKKDALRTPADIIRASLNAQAAAWNEGDLEGFMEGYWKSDELKFVSGGEITRGWSSTMKRYRDRYAGGEGLGQLSFERLEPKLVTDDVAVVTGRFNLLQGGETSSGVFTVVMRRDNGAWRIVHDHTSGEQNAG